MKLFKMFCAVLVFASSMCSGAHYATPQAPLLGVAWYPEQSPEARWDTDLSLMESAHMHVVRIGEFAWSTLEPKEDKYDLGWIERAIAGAQRHHIRVVIGTPTDAPPAWLTMKYPETLGVDADGRRREHGGRRQFNYANPHYRELCRNIVAMLAERFGNNPNVIGWQIGNEYTDESFDADTRAQFQQFLKTKYGTLESLNQHWTTAYWSQTYNDWSQIPMDTTRGNPGLLLDHKHFVTDTWRSFQKVQIDELRKHISKAQFITTNIGGLAWSDNWDHYAISADLDIASWDDYVGQGHLQVERNAMLNDFARGWRRSNYWVMETEPGSVNWAPISNALDRGETRQLAWQAVGHGADAVLYWQWRAALNGQEEYHGAIAGPDGSPLPIYQEIQQLGQDFEQVQNALKDTAPLSEVALLHMYDSRWAIDFQPHTDRYDQQKVMLSFYGPLARYAQRSGHSVDIIDPTSGGSLSHYKFLVAPGFNVISQRLADLLLEWVRGGGHLLLGPRSGMKDDFNALNIERQPGPLTYALGARVEQYYAMEKAIPLEGTGQADIWAEALEVLKPDAHVQLKYGKTEGGWLDGQPAMVTRTVGKGTLSYLGTLPDKLTMTRLLEESAHAAGVAKPLYDLPETVELCVRRAMNRGGTSAFILINHGTEEEHVHLSGAFRDALSGKDGSYSKEGININLQSHGIAVLEKSDSRRAQ